MSFSEQMASRGLEAYSRILSVSKVDDRPDISARLSLPPDERLWKVERLRLGAGEPFAVETVHMSARTFPALTRPRLERGSLFSLLEGEYGVALAHADEEIDVTAADAKTAELLAVPAGAALLRIRQVIFSVDGRAILLVLGLYRSDRHTLLIRRFR
jgi:GntR family transcriptional regulator